MALQEDTNFTGGISMFNDDDDVQLYFPSAIVCMYITALICGYTHLGSFGLGFFKNISQCSFKYNVHYRSHDGTLS